MQAKDIPDHVILNIVRQHNEGSVPDYVIDWGGTREPVTITGERWCLIWDLEERMPDYPSKVILAKCKSLIRRGKMHGCTCGCRGDFFLDGYGWY